MDKLKFLTLAYAVVFLALFVIAIYRLIDINKIGEEIKGQYAVILQNLSCTYKNNLTAIRDRGCLKHGYWYPICQNDTDGLNLYGGMQ